MVGPSSGPNKGLGSASQPTKGEVERKLAALTQYERATVVDGF
jgi:hypothetical protein